jgi:hypothetical protein
VTRQLAGDRAHPVEIDYFHVHIAET